MGKAGTFSFTKDGASVGVNVAFFLLSDKAPFVNGITIPADGGITA
jgi:hypothetical protein